MPDGRAAVKDAVGIEDTSKPETLSERGTTLEIPLVVIYIVDASVVVGVVVVMITVVVSCCVVLCTVVDVMTVVCSVVLVGLGVGVVNVVVGPPPEVPVVVIPRDVDCVGEDDVVEVVVAAVINHT